MSADLDPGSAPDLDATTIRERVRPVFETRPEILCVYLFGSMAAGHAGRRSDVDLAVLTTTDRPRPREVWETYWGQLHGDLARALDLPAGRVDLVLLDEVRDPLLRQRATWNGLVLLCRDHRERVRLETGILRTYLDTIPLRRLQEQSLRQAVRERREATGGS